MAIHSAPKAIPLDGAFAAIFEAINHADSERLAQISYAVAAVSERIAVRLMTVPQLETSDAPDRNLNVTEAARRLGMSPHWLYRNWAKRRLGSRIDGRLVFSERRIDRFIKQPPGG